MKRFKIKNNKNGLEFQIEAESLVMQPEHGKPERWVSGADASDEEKASALETREVIEMNEKLVEYRLPADYVIVEEDMAAEIAEKASKKEADKNQRDAIAALMSKNMSNAELQLVVKAVAKKVFEI